MWMSVKCYDQMEYWRITRIQRCCTLYQLPYILCLVQSSLAPTTWQHFTCNMQRTIGLVHGYVRLPDVIFFKPKLMWHGRFFDVLCLNKNSMRVFGRSSQPNPLFWGNVLKITMPSVFWAYNLVFEAPWAHSIAVTCNPPVSLIIMSQ